MCLRVIQRGAGVNTVCMYQECASNVVEMYIVRMYFTELCVTPYSGGCTLSGWVRDFMEARACPYKTRCDTM